MISPFAFYWYSLYAPALQRLHGWRATAWLDAFFLPHSVITTSAVLEFLRWRVGVYSLTLGGIGFLFCAAQVYGLKLLRGGVAHSWIYSRIRHPQYLCLAVAGFGLMTMWPRIIILVLYIGMLIIYYFLAGFEEKEMERKYTDYAAYRQRTAMFIPGSPGGKLFRIFFGWIANRSVALTASSIIVIALVIGGGLLLRRYTVGHVATQLLPQDRTLAIAVWPMSSDKIRQIVSVALRDEQIQSALNKEPGAVFTAHLLPANYGMIAMFVDVGIDHRKFGHLSPHSFRYTLEAAFPFFKAHLNEAMGTPQENYKVVFSRVDGANHMPVPISGITGLDAKMTPVVIAHIGGEPPALQKVVVPPRRSFWGNITMPMF